MRNISLPEDVFATLYELATESVSETIDMVNDGTNETYPSIETLQALEIAGEALRGDEPGKTHEEIDEAFDIKWPWGYTDGGEERVAYRNYYECEGCDEPHEHITWEDEWSCMCNDRCPVCRAEIQPYNSEEL